MIRRPPRSTLFPYTTLFRSRDPGKRLGDAHHLLLVGDDAVGVLEDRLELGELVGDRLLAALAPDVDVVHPGDRKSTRLNSSHANISYAVFCLKKKKTRCYLP